LQNYGRQAAGCRLHAGGCGQHRQAAGLRGDCGRGGQAGPGRACGGVFCMRSGACAVGVSALESALYTGRVRGADCGGGPGGISKTFAPVESYSRHFHRVAPACAAPDSSRVSPGRVARAAIDTTTSRTQGYTVRYIASCSRPVVHQPFLQAFERRALHGWDWQSHAAQSCCGGKAPENSPPSQPAASPSPGRFWNVAWADSYKDRSRSRATRVEAGSALTDLPRDAR
jgi:hypothetical protein